MQIIGAVLWAWQAAGAPALPAADPNALAAEEIAAGWIQLFDGQTLFGWKPASQAEWRVADGTITVDQGEPGLLVTTSEFSDFELRAEFRAPAATNSGIFLRTPPRPMNPQADCYELNIAAPAVSPYPTGSFVGRQKAVAEVPADAWHRFEVRAQGGRFQVHLDGQLVLDYTDPRPLGRGRIGLQLNQGGVAFRRVHLRPLGLAELFNGRDLAGWQPQPGKPSRFAVTSQGELSVVDGPGALETAAQFGDFVLQLDVMTQGQHLNSGVFFRCLPGQFCQGYESQIHNGFRNGDRSRPIDCGTGGFYRRQNARRVVADDHAWFTKTLIVSGKHMAAWVNGYQVSDWTDPRPDHENPRSGARTAAGTLMIQGHDPTTNLLLRKVRGAELTLRSPADAR
jgi:hypothetical protein